MTRPGRAPKSLVAALLALGLVALGPTPRLLAASSPVPLSTTGETLSILMSDVSLPDKSFNRDVFPILLALEKATGVHIKIEALGSFSYGDVLQTRLAEGTNLPDMILVGNGFDTVRLGKAGTILPLQDLIARNAPEMVALMKKYPDIPGAITDPNGTIWGWPARVSEWDAQFSQWGPGFRYDWAHKLGLPEPRSIADWEAMLTAFRTRDPNGNGRADEIPFGGEVDLLGYSFAQAFNLSRWSNWWSVQNGRVDYDFVGFNSENARAWLATMNRWYQKGLLDPDLLIPHGDKAEAQIQSGQVGATGRWNPSWDAYNEQMKASSPGVKWLAAFPATGPGGLGGVAEKYPAVNRDRILVTKSAKNPALVIRWLNYLFATEAGQRLFNFGVEGLTYTLVDGKPRFTDVILHNPKYANPSLAMASFGADRFPSFVLPDAFAQVTSFMPPESLARLAKFKTRFFFPEPTMTPEESTAYNARMADIQNYVDEMVGKFIVGSEPLSSYPGFVARLRSMGIDDATRLKQTLFDRFSHR
ncbi:MAG: extracellular solute-binding protein [Spirochaetales bacterium]